MEGRLPSLVGRANAGRGFGRTELSVLTEMVGGGARRGEEILEVGGSGEGGIERP